MTDTNTTKQVACPQCSGIGNVKQGPFPQTGYSVTCPRCDGKGAVRVLR